MTPRRAAQWLARAALLACLSRGARAFPVFFTANGSAVVTSAHGADVVLQPDGAGSVVTRALLQATAGVQLNATTLNEAVLSNLLALAQAQSATLAQLVAGAGGATAVQPSSYQLTTCGMTDPMGPNLPFCRDAYAAAGATWAADPTVYGFGAPAGGNVSNWQKLTLPQAGRYRISVAGASGQTEPRPSNQQSLCLCRGAIVQTVVNLAAGTTLYALIGSQGSGPQAQANSGVGGSGAGGGTFLLFANGTALAVAGGGGSGPNVYVPCNPQGSVCDASFTTAGQPAWIGSTTQSDNGAGGPSECFTGLPCPAGQAFNSGGGGLLSSAPADSTFGGTAALYGGYGAVYSSYIANAGMVAKGGFGGGGVSLSGAAGAPAGLQITAGGGGYSGGAGGQYPNIPYPYFLSYEPRAALGGGGGSFCGGTGVCNFGYNTPNTNGYATIALMSGE